MSKSVVARWSSGLRLTVDSTDGGQVTLEGEEGTPGYRPSALLLAALAGCTAMDVISILRKKRQQVDRYEVVVEGRQRASHPRTFETIHVEHRLVGSALDGGAVSRAIELSATHYCPVTTHIAQGDVAIHHGFRIDDGDDSVTAEVVVTGPRGEGLSPIELHG